ncbi:MAG: transposase [Thermodesulfobacteriota bacterium]|nr:transposase [Thermodesulfobacteriota bacterium]
MGKHTTTSCDPPKSLSEHRRNNRLSLDLYLGRRIYFITINTAGKNPVFIADAVVSHHLKILSSASSAHCFDVIAYCYMPDHVHLLIAGRKQASDLIAFIKAYKQTTGYRFKQAVGDVLWQKSYYDHILRKDEDVREVVRYILANPLRKGMVERPAAYPYAGSLVYGPDIFQI